MIILHHLCKQVQQQDARVNKKLAEVQPRSSRHHGCPCPTKESRGSGQAAPQMPGSTDRGLAGHDKEIQDIQSPGQWLEDKFDSLDGLPHHHVDLKANTTKPNAQEESTETISW